MTHEEKITFVTLHFRDLYIFITFRIKSSDKFSWSVFICDYYYFSFFTPLDLTSAVHLVFEFHFIFRRILITLYGKIKKVKCIMVGEETLK